MYTELSELYFIMVWRGVYEECFVSEITKRILTAFHQIASKVAAPLSKTDEIVILSGEGSRVTGEVNRLLAELPVSVNALTGVDLSKVRVQTVYFSRALLAVLLF